MIQELAGIDFKAALDRLQVNVEIYKKSLLSFAESYTDIIEKIKNALNEKNTTEARELLHTLRGSSVNIGADQVESAAEKLGNAVKAGKGDLESLIHNLDIATKTVLDSIRSIPAGTGDRNPL